MSDDIWNDDIAYSFSTHRTLMQIAGIWPLQKKTTVTIIQWNVMLFLQLSPLIFLYMELTGKNSDANANIEVTLYFTSVLSLNLKYICFAANRGHLAKNIIAASADWSSAKNEVGSYKIMKKYASNSRLCTIFLLYSSYICGSLYILSVIVIELKKVFLEDQMVNISNGSVSATERMFIIPCGEFGNRITGLQYAILIAFQAIQLLVTCTMLPIADSFYINLTLHLTGQLNVLKKKFQNFANKPDFQLNHRKQLISLINRHCELMERNQNLEDTFNLIILYQLVVGTLILALIGLRIIFCSKYKYYVELLKNILVLNYIFMQSMLYCYGGDFVQKGSEGIFHAMFTASWFTLPATLMKDFNFAMMRSSYPFRLTGGKFFYTNCEAIVYILKTAASYVSVLRVKLRDY